MHARHLYVHVPFCGRRCVYCDFSIAVRATVPVRDFVDGVRREWQARLADTQPTLDTLYFGGGTPSKLGGDGVARLLDVVRERATIAGGAEVTLEANPEDVTDAAARAWKASGVNRISLGVQSFDDRVLAWMHRTHDAATAGRAVHTLRDAGIDNISIDIIFALPAHLGRVLQSDLDEAGSLGLPHMSVYGLTVEPHTPLGRWVARKDVTESPEEVFEREFLLTHEVLTSSGMEHYEVSNFGRSGMHSRHNWAYWQRKAYLGIGPSAHEFDGATRRWNSEAYTRWLHLVYDGKDPAAGTEHLTESEALSEQLYLSLRTHTGLVLARSELEHVASWIEAGWASVDEANRLRLTPRGWLRLDALANDLTLRRSRY